MSDRVKFQGGSALMMGSGVIGVVGLAATFFRAMSAVEGKQSFLVAFTFWFCLAMSSLLLLMIWHASKTKWIVVIRRPLEIMASTVWLFGLLFIPIWMWRESYWPWARSFAGLDEESLHMLEHRQVWMNTHAVLTRVVVFFAIWVLISHLFLSWSTKQDQSKDTRLSGWAYRLGAGALPLVALTFTCAAFDWYMSLETKWFSSIWGVYLFAGSVLSVFSLLVVVFTSLSESPSYKGTLHKAHWLSIGKFMLAFTAFWAYIAFSQAMLTWVANLPDTIPFLLARVEGNWKYLTEFLVVGHFVIPFLILLSRDVKMRPKVLRVVAVWILFVNYVDVYWMLMPSMHADVFDWSQVTAFLGIGGLATSVFLFRLRGRYAIPVGDPFLTDSLEYAQI